MSHPGEDTDHPVNATAEPPDHGPTHNTRTGRATRRDRTGARRPASGPAALHGRCHPAIRPGRRKP
ncbi:hypothetical protein ACWDR3_19575 [Streptomyces sp. NPDC001002]